MPTSIIQVSDLGKTFWVHKKKEGFVESVKSLFYRPETAIQAVNNISFDISPGEIVGFLGPNGAGKTTTLKTLSGLIHPTSGQVSVAGYKPSELKHDFLRTITLVMGQKQQLMWDLSAADSFRLNKVIFDIPDKVFNSNISTLTEMLEISDILNKPQRTLSLGERMKCELAAALLHNPKILFLDEPTIGMDIVIQKKVRSFVNEYREKYGATILLTSHYMGDVTELVDRILVIDKGELIFQGNNRELIDKFNDQKLLKLYFREVINEQQLSQYGLVKKHDDLAAEIYVDRELISEVSSKLLKDFPITDITIEDLPFEQALASLYQN